MMMRATNLLLLFLVTECTAVRDKSNGRGGGQVDVDEGDESCVHTKMIPRSSSIKCWGWDGFNQVSGTPEDKDYVKVAAGNRHTCALKTDGDVVCWGDEKWGAIKPPKGKKFVDIGAAGRHTCGWNAEGDATCWGHEYHEVIKVPSDTKFSHISPGDTHNCGLVAGPDGPDVNVKCWGSNGHEQLNVPDGHKYVHVSSGGDHSCGLTEEGDAFCWGDYADNQGKKGVESGSGGFEYLVAGRFHTCGIKKDGKTAECWGWNGINQINVPEDQSLHAIALGFSHTCYASEGGQVKCTGSSEYGELEVPVDVLFYSLDAGAHHTCGLVSGYVASLTDK